MKIVLVSSLLFLAAGATALAQSPGTFTGTGSMITPRVGHSATLLLDGRVLIAGGRAATQNSAPLASAEIYDPETKTFSPTGDMNILHGGAAALLPNGKVLFVGPGSRGLGVEVYDPLTGTFSVAVDLEDTDIGFCGVTLLLNGKLLLTGCAWWPPWDAPSYLYDPASAAFTTTGKYATDTLWMDENIRPVSVLLADGKVLTTWEAWKAEVYNPDTGTYLRTGDLAPSSADWGYSTTLLPNGNVLIAGGDGNPINQLYDPAAGKFTPTGNMKETRAGQNATLLSDGTVLITGGRGSDPPTLALALAELYHPDSGTFTATGAMTPREGHTATLLPDGTVLIAGGVPRIDFQAVAGLDSAEIYHPAQTRPAPVLLSATDGQAAVLHASTHQIVSQSAPAAAGEALEIYMTGLTDGSVIPPQVFIGGRIAEVLFFGNAPGYPGLNQIDVRVPAGIAPGPAVRVRVVYLDRPSKEVTIPMR